MQFCVATQRVRSIRTLTPLSSLSSYSSTVLDRGGFGGHDGGGKLRYDHIQQIPCGVVAH